LLGEQASAEAFSIRIKACPYSRGCPEQKDIYIWLSTSSDPLTSSMWDTRRWPSSIMDSRCNCSGTSSPAFPSGHTIQLNLCQCQCPCAAGLWLCLFLSHTYVNSCFKLINQSWANFLPDVFHICGWRNVAVAVLDIPPRMHCSFWIKNIYSYI